MVKKRVFQIIPNLALAGAEIMLENLIFGLHNDDFEVSVVSLYNEQSAITKRLEDQNISLYYLGKKKGIDIRMIYRLYTLFIKEKPDVVHTHRYAMQYAIPAALMAKVPVKIHTIHNIAKKEVGKIQRKLHCFFYRYCSVIPVAISPIVKHSVMIEYNMASYQVPMIYNGIDTKKCIQKREYVAKNGKVTIIHIGRFTEQKNHKELIESFKLVHDNKPDTVLKLIGAGKLEQNIRKKVKELNLDDCVEFLGLKSNVYPYLYNADIFVLPSLWEGMPITLIEAMGTGLPIVATEVGGIPDMIRNNETGLLVDANRDQISEALLKLINTENLRERIGKAAIEASRQFSVEEMTNKYAKLYTES